MCPKLVTLHLPSAVHPAANSFLQASHPKRILSMRLTAVILVNISTFIVPTFTLSKTPPIPSRLNITAIGAANGRSSLECWQLSAPLVQSTQAGTSGAAIAQLGETGATSYTILPPHFDGGFHNAPAVQCVLPSTLWFSHPRPYHFQTPTSPSVF